jgi:hypothetical protein
MPRISKLPLPSLWLVSTLLCAVVFGQSDSWRAGTTAFSFLSISYDARTAAMGSAATGMPNNLYGIRSNPATTAYAGRQQLMASYVPYFSDVGIKGLQWGYSFPLLVANKPFGTLSGDLIYLSYGSLQEIDENKIVTGKIWNSYSLAGGITWSNTIWETLAIGATVKGLTEPIFSSDKYYVTNGAAIDAGAQYRLDYSRLILGIAVRNIGISHTNSGTADPGLPVGGSIGMSFVPQVLPKARIALDMDKAIDDFLTFKTGVEFDAFHRQLFLRGGYSFSTRDVQEGMRRLQGEEGDSYQKANWSGLSVGVGLATVMSGVDVRIDAAYQLRTSGIAPAPVFSALVSF